MLDYNEDARYTLSEIYHHPWLNAEDDLTLDEIQSEMSKRSCIIQQ